MSEGKKFWVKGRYSEAIPLLVADQVMGIENVSEFIFDRSEAVTREKEELEQEYQLDMALSAAKASATMADVDRINWRCNRRRELGEEEKALITFVGVLKGYLNK